VEIDLFILVCISVTTEITEHKVSLPTLPQGSRLPGNLDVGIWSFLDWFPLILFPCLVWMSRNYLPSWVFMWAMAFAIFTGCKWLTWRKACGESVRPSPKRSLAYLFLWPGMNASEFLRISQNRGSLWKLSSPLPILIGPVAKICLGALLLAVSAHQSNQWHPLIAGWVAMFGLILIFHFGAFQLLAIFWQRAGINAQPLMQSPFHSRSLAEFWGKRWNTAFSNLVHEFVFRPLARSWGSSAATLVVFAISGLIHEAVISLPARAGYALPTAYFLLQGCGILLERSRLRRQVDLGSGLRGRLFAIGVTALPAFGLFHPPFIHNVILPMLRFISQS